MKKTILFFLMLLGCMGLRAQNVALAESFYFPNLESQNQQMANSDNDDYPGWEFDNCYRIKNYFLQIGSGSAPFNLGKVMTKPLGLNGNATLLIKLMRIENIEAKFIISVEGGGTTSDKEYTVGEGSEYRPSAIFIKNCTPSTRIKITSTYGKFYIKSIKVYDIGPAFFYESFNYMTGATNSSEFSYNDASDNNLPKSSLCDNTAAVFQVGSEHYLRKANGSICFLEQNNNLYTTPSFTECQSDKALLSFRVARTNSNNVNYWFKVSASESAKLSPVNSTDLNDSEASRTQDISGLEKESWKNYKFILTGLTTDSKLSFTGKYFYLDNILLRPLPSATTIDENADNSDYLDVYDGMVHNVTLTRTLTEGIWNTLCLPFDVTSTMIGLGAELRTLTSSADGEFVFNSVDEVSAGTPFLVKVTSEVKDPTFENVTVKNVEPQPVGDDDNYKFCGTYSPIYLNIDGTHLFLGKNGAFYKPTAEGNRMNGLRAYFIVPSSGTARVSILDEPSAIHSVEADVMVNTGYYDLTGRRHDEQHLTRGLYVRNGKKFFVK